MASKQNGKLMKGNLIKWQINQKWKLTEVSKLLQSQVGKKQLDVLAS
jgi:hypothetical protein